MVDDLIPDELIEAVTPENRHPDWDEVRNRTKEIMRKGYGPTDVSYAIGLNQFTAKIRSGLKIALGYNQYKEEVVEAADIPRDLSDASIERMFKAANCICYHDGVEMVIPSFCR